MSDNTQLNAPTSTGDVISTDDLGTAKVQNTKVVFGADGTMTRVTPGTPLPVDPSGVTSPVSAAALPLPANAAQETGGNLAAILAKLISSPATSANQATEIAGLAAILTQLQSLLSVAVSNFPGTQPVSGTLTVQQATGSNLHVVVDSGVITSITNALPAGTNVIGHVIVDSITGSIAITAASLPLPANAAQETGGNLAAIKSDTDKIPSQGQALAAASMPVVLTAIQQAALTPPAAITNYANEAGGNLAAIKADTDKIPSQGQAAMAASTPVVIASNQSSIPVTVGNFPATQPVSDTAVVVDSDTNYTEGSQSNLTVTASGKLRIKWDDEQRRNQELMLIEIQKQTLVQMFINEPYSGSRYGVEIR
jgi:hypothetical protein